MSDIPPAAPGPGDDGGQPDGMSPNESILDQALAGFFRAAREGLRLAGVVTAAFLLMRLFVLFLQGPTIATVLPMYLLAACLAVHETVTMYADIEAHERSNLPASVLVTQWSIPLLAFAFLAILPQSRLWAGAAYSGLVAAVHLAGWVWARERWDSRKWLPRTVMEDLKVPPVYQLGVNLVLLVWGIAAFFAPHRDVRLDLAAGIDEFIDDPRDAISFVLSGDGDATLTGSLPEAPEPEPSSTTAPARDHLPEVEGTREIPATTTTEPTLEDICDGVVQLAAVRSRAPALTDAMEHAWTRAGGREVGCPSGEIRFTVGGAVIVGLEGGESDPAAVVGSLIWSEVASVVFAPRMPLLDALSVADTLVAVGARTDLGENSDYQVYFTTDGCVLSFRDRQPDPDELVTFPEEVTYLLLGLAGARSSLIWRANLIVDTPPLEAYQFSLFNPVSRQVTVAEVLRDPVRGAARISSIDGSLPEEATAWIETPAPCGNALEAFDARAADNQRRVAAADD